MCGIAGMFRASGSTASMDHELDCMVRGISQRGPDGRSLWIGQNGLALAHTRLSIIDLTDAGKQPMTSGSGRYVLTFNGEIYNFPQLRKQLEERGVVLLGHSDTEVFLETIELYGLDSALQQSVGMFAFALWDSTEGILHLGRDRYGEKPLYYGQYGDALVFSSELKSFFNLPGFTLDIDEHALSAFVKYGYVPSPHCILRGFRKLPAGSTLSGNSGQALLQNKPKFYWSLSDADEEAKKLQEQRHLYADSDSATSSLEQLLSQVIDGQMISDVPIGGFLSGGVDSSLICALMQSQSDTAVDTFTIGFSEKEFDESVYAGKVAQHLGTNHHEWIVTEKDVLDIVSELPRMYDEPFADASQLPTALLAKLVRQKVTVCLSGDGGDEFFGGYNRYVHGPAVRKNINRIPGPLKWLLYKLAANSDVASKVRLYKLLERLSGKAVAYPADKIDKFVGLLACNNDEALFDRLLATWPEPESLLSSGLTSGIVDSFSADYDFTVNMMRHDQRHYLVDDIMTKVDRAAMAVGLETRAPFLDHRVTAFAASLPMAEKISNGTSKVALRNILYRHVPRNLIERPKAGFAVPLAGWFREDMRDLMEDVFSEDSLSKSGFFNAAPIRQAWTDHREGKANNQYRLWNIFVFQQWFDHWNQYCNGAKL